MEHINCPYCEAEFDPEIGPDEAMQVAVDTAKRIQGDEGEVVEKRDALRSLAITGGNFEWI